MNLESKYFPNQNKNSIRNINFLRNHSLFRSLNKYYIITLENVLTFPAG